MKITCTKRGVHPSLVHVIFRRFSISFLVNLRLGSQRQLTSDFLVYFSVFYLGQVKGTLDFVPYPYSNLATWFLYSSGNAYKASSNIN